MPNNVHTDPRPHMLPGVYAWFVENFPRVYFTILADHPKFSGPKGLPLNNDHMFPVLSADGGLDGIRNYYFRTVTLDFGINAIGKFSQDAEGFEVGMRFGGKPHTVYVPFDAVTMVYAPDDIACVPYRFCLMPGQEKLNINYDKKSDTAPVAAVSNGSAEITQNENKSSRRINHLQVVK